MTPPLEPSVLVAVQFDEQSDDAIRQADAWARETRAELVACHALRPALDELVDVDDVRRAVSERIVTLTRRTDARVHAAIGAPQAAILRTAETYRPTLIALGGERFTRDAVFGPGLRGRIARQARCSVLIARPCGDGPIVAGTDLSSHGDRAVRYAARVARRRKKPLLVVHAAHVPLSALGKLRGLIDPRAAAALQERRLAEARTAVSGLVAELDCEAAPVVVPGRPADAIVQAAKAHDASMVVVGALGRTAHERSRIGGVAETLVYSDCPTLIIVRPPVSTEPRW